MEMSPDPAGKVFEKPRGNPFEPDLKKVLRGLFRHLLLIVFLSLIGASLGAYLSYKLSRLHRATSVLIYQKEQKGPIEQGYSILRLTLPAAVESITLPSNLRAVASRLGLDWTVEEMKEKIEVALPARDSNLIYVEAATASPELSVEIANGLAEAAAAESRQLARDQWREAESYFVQQEARLKEELNEKLQEIARFRQRYELIGEASGSSPFVSYGEAKRRFESADLEYHQLLATYENLKREYEVIPETVSALEEQSQIDYLENALNEARAKYAEENPKIRSLEAQLGGLRERSRAGVGRVNPLKQQLDLELIGLKAKIRSAQKLRNLIGERLEEMKEGLAELSDRGIAFSELVDQQRLLESQIAKNEEIQRIARIMFHIGKGDLELYQRAEKALEGSSFFAYLLPPFGLLAGAFLGLVSAGLLEIADQNLRTKREVETRYSIPCCAAIPELADLNPSNAEEKLLPFIRSLTEHLQHSRKYGSVLALTSSLSNEGKSLLSYQLAKYYERLGKSVLLAGVDWRENSFYKPPSTKTLTDYLKGGAEWEEIVSERGGLCLVGASEDPRMKELLKGPKLEELLSKIKERFDLAIFDLPGVLKESYAANFAEKSDMVLFVVDSSGVKKGLVDRSLKELKVVRAAPDGLILNRIDPIYADGPFPSEERGLFQAFWSQGGR